MSDEVSQFLQQVERLRGQQIEDDGARAREREEFLAAKRERQARREERARSISPQKSSPRNTPSPHLNRQSVQAPNSARINSPGRGSHDRQLPDTPSLNPNGPLSPQSLSTGNKEASVEAETIKSESSTSPTRTSTLSWQRRPASRGGVRPLSMVAAQNATQRSLADTQGPKSATEPNLSKDQIAKTLGSKDPTWFRQTADRGLGSAAYRRTQVEDEDRSYMSLVSAQLPGMCDEDAIPKNDSRLKHDSKDSHHSKLVSPVIFKPASFDGASEDIRQAQDFSTISGRVCSPRPASPTKGLGGFVQSAMMKRSDSVKRWSVTSPPGLTRSDSVAATRGTYDRSSVQLGTRKHNPTQERSTTPTSSRSTSRHADKASELELPSRSSTGDVSHDNERDGEVASTPTSPSRTMDPRRWSPTKSSWLESALNRPESPKLAASPTQATWRDKAAVEPKRPISISHKHQVSIGGLLRQSPLGSVAKSNPTGLGGIYSPPPNANRPAFGHGSKPSISQKRPDLESGHTDAEAQSGKVQNATEQSALVESATPTPTMSPPPTGVRPKAQAPPFKDFRSSLRQRAVESEAPKPDEPEFKNVFGNLRRTKTQKYVAPDELKDNILRGKASLNNTDGPKRSERRDEFKDAILRKKADFKAAQVEGRGVTRTPSNASEEPMPEGLTRRADLGSRSVATTTKKNSFSETPPAAPVKKADSPKPTPGRKNISIGSAFSPRSPNSTQPSPLAKSPNTEKLRRISTEPQPAKTKVGGSQPPPLLHKETSAPSKLSAQDQVGARRGNLADRFNPALAGLLAKGPPGMSTDSGRGADDSGEPVSSEPGTLTESPVSVPHLTHMTKNRARGPKRKAPTTSTATTPTARSGQLQNSSTSATTPETAPETAPLTTGSRREASAGPLKDEKPDVVGISPSQEKPASASVQERVAFAASLQDNSSPKSPKKLDMNRMSRFLDEGPSYKVEQEPAREQARLEQQRTGSRSPTKLVEPPSPTKSDRDSLPSMNASPRRHDVRQPAMAKPSFVEPLTTTSGPQNRGRGPLSGFSTESLEPPARMASPARSPTKQANEVSTILSDFFGPAQTRQAMKFDPAQILMNRPQTGDKVTCLGLQMFQMLGDGKKLPVSPQHERVLFDQEMYVCAHNFADRSGKKAFEIYFWVGDEVPESSAEDALLFVQRECRSLGGKLVKLRQGKETAEFVQALGGVIIVRKGCSNKYDSLVPSMLCGRRYLGQVAFDEVEYSSSNLCSGFTYLISRGGICYMWKGKGSDVTEVSCARLVGMDLTLTGELIECEDGGEPASFWKLFGDESSRPHSADHWRLKPSYDKYCSRLFCSDADSRQQIFEISPFNQEDLSSAGIYVLDAFFEIYIVVGSRANSQYSSFRNALDFAQEYAILASGMEDRPFVPVSTVVLEGIPRDMKRVFRNWDDKKNPTVTNTAGSGSGLRRGRSLRVVTLTQALQALIE